MPIYAYQCKECNTQADYLVKLNQQTAPPCKECGSIEQEKQLSTGTGFCLMGHGWYKNGMSSKKVGR